MATIQSTRYVIGVHDLEQSAQFYRDVLGFQVKTIEDDGWLFFEKDQCIIMAGRCENAISPKDLGDHSYFAYICVDQIDAYFQQVQERGARILKKPRDEPWGMREFAVETADGHRIMFAAGRADEAG